MINSSISHQDLTYRIIGCAMRVHRRTQRGLREKHYQRAFDEEMIQEGLTTEMEHPREIYDGETWMGILYLDHWVNECIVVEDKAVTYPMTDKDKAQIIAYLAATGSQVGLFINFGRSSLEYHRILPPKTLQGWQKNIQQYLWTPKTNGRGWTRGSGRTYEETDAELLLPPSIGPANQEEDSTDVIDW
jgi:GxxExxY protein